VVQVLALAQAGFRARCKNPPREGNFMSKTSVRIRASKSNGEATLPAVAGPRSADSQTIHPARNSGSGRPTNAPLGNHLFAALSESLAPLLAETAHDLKNAFVSIRLHFDLLELESASPERVRQCLREIRPMLDQAQDLTRQLMNPVTPGHTGKQEAQGKPDSPCMPKISLNPVLERVAPMLSAILQSEVALRLRVAASLEEASRMLHGKTCGVGVMDAGLVETDPKGVDHLLFEYPAALPNFPKLAVCSPERLVCEIKAALRRGKKEKQRATDCARQEFRSNLKDSVTALLLNCDLTLQLPDLPSEIGKKINLLRDLAARMRDQLEVDLREAASA
jgi:hypothetical protein